MNAKLAVILEYIISCNTSHGEAYHLFQGYEKDRVFVAKTDVVTEKVASPTGHVQKDSSPITYVQYYANKLAVLN